MEMGHARALLTLSEPLQIKASDMIMTKGLSVRQAEELARLMQLPKFEPAPEKSMDPDVKRLQQDLSQRLKMPVAILCNPKGKGKLVIRYKNLTELDGLLEYFQ